MGEPGQTPELFAKAGLRDLFLSYNSASREAVMSVRRALSAREVSTFYDRTDLNAGQPWFDELEAALRKVRGVAVFIGRDGLGTIQKREMQFALNRQASEEREGRRFPVIPVLLEGVDLEAVSGFLALNTWVDLRRQLDDPAVLGGLVKALGQGAPSKPAESAAAICPFRGLNAFREEDAALFFGREAFAQRLLTLVLKRNFVAVIGRSGSGKSSVVQAGLLPLLRRQKPPEETWESVILTPGNKPFHRLAAQLVPLWSVPDRDQTDIGTESEKLGERLLSGEVKLAGFVDLALKHLKETSRLLIIVDQFEELFTLTSTEEQRQRFVEQLLSASLETNLTVVLTLRADFYGQAIKMRNLSDAIETGVVNLSEMTRTELQEAIEEPERRSGLRFEAGLVGRILDQVEQQPGSLPLLEFALTELWQRRQSGHLTHASYDAIGGVEGAINKRAEGQFSKLTPAQQKIALKALSRLVRVSSASEEGTDTRQVIRLSELDSNAQAVIRVFAAKEARLVVTGRDETSDAETVEVAHEALIRSWNKLKQWIDQDRQFLLWRQQLRPFLEKWRALLKNKDSALLQGVYLTEAQHWLRERNEDLNAEERQFIEASERPGIKSRRLKRVTGAAVTVAVLAVCSYIVWTRTDSYQVRAVLSIDPRVIASANERSGSAWTGTLARVGRVREALTDSGRIVNPEERAEVQASLARVLSENGRSQEAIEAATGALASLGSRDNTFNASADVSVIRALVRVGKTHEAVAAALEAKDKNTQDACFEGMADVLITAGRAAEVVTLVTAVQDRGARDEAIFSVLQPLATKGQIAEVQELAGKIQNPEWKPYRFVAMAWALAEARKSEEAANDAQEALKMTHAVKDVSWRDYLLGSTARVLIVAGRTSQALAITPDIVDENKHDVVVVWAAEKLAESGQEEEAIVTAKRIRNVSTRRNGLESVVVKLAASGHTREAIDAVAVMGLDPLPEGLMTVVNSLIEVGKPEEALGVARQIKDPAQRGSALMYTAQGLARSGKRAEAEGAAAEALPDVRRIKDPSARAGSLIIGMDVLGNAGTTEEAKSVTREAVAAAEAIEDDAERSNAFSEVAVAYAKLHAYRRARLTADICTSSADKLTAYAAIVREHSIQHHPELAKSFSDDTN